MKRILFFTVLALLTSACSSSIDGEDSGDAMGNGMGVSDENLDLMEKNRWGGGNIPVAGKDGLFDDVFFDYDSSIVNQKDRERLQKDSKVILDDPDLKVEVEGHCDKRGTNEYNLALGEARAKAVATLLSGFGVPAKQISTISYGEEIPLDPADSDTAFAKNRRVHFAIYRDKKQK